MIHRLTMVSFSKEILFNALSVVVVIAAAFSILEGRIGHYTPLPSNCLLNDLNSSKVSESLGMCALECTKKSTCQAFASRGVECILLGNCPICCTPSADPNNGWKVFCPISDGKMHRNAPA